MPRNRHIDLPADLDLKSADSMPVVNDRLRRLASELQRLFREIRALQAETAELDLPSDPTFNSVTLRFADGGYIIVHSGDATVSGRIEWYLADDTLLGTLGDDAADLVLALSGGANLRIAGGATRVEGTLRLVPLTGPSPLKVNASEDVIAEKISLTNANDITATSLGATQKALFWNAGVVGEIAGITVASAPIITSVVPTTMTLDYLDHASAPQSQTIVIDVAVGSVLANFTEGIWTS
jgi:hypothetical protein